MVPEFRHKINEFVTVLREAEGDLFLRIRRVSDNYYFNPLTAQFEEFNGLSNYNIELVDFYDTGLKSVTIFDLPKISQDLFFEYRETVLDDEEEGEIISSFERRIFGATSSTNDTPMCIVYGTLKDVSGKPMAGREIQVFLNRAGYFVHKAGLVGHAANALTDSSGYFEIPLLIGLDVTINVPSVGFSTRGYVPNVASVELSSHMLLSFNPC